MMREDRIRVGFVNGVRILAPWASAKFMEQVRAVIPLVALMFVFQLLVLQSGIDHALTISGGILAVIIGLAFFMEGLRLGLMPIGEVLGSRLPVKAPFVVVLVILFVLGIGVTLAEPAIGTLQSVGASVDPAKAPFLYSLLKDHAAVLALAIGLGVGIAAVLGTLRFVYGFSLSRYLFPVVGLTTVLTIIAALTPGVREIIGLAWDSGAITTGPVTVPLVLALGIGIARVLAKKHDSGMGGFGIVTLASLFPIIGVLLLGFVLHLSGAIDPAQVRAVTQASVGGAELVASIAITSAQAIIPLVIFLFIIQLLVVRERIHNLREIFLGIIFCLAGMMIFNFGLSFGLVPLGDQLGGLMPAAFSTITGGAPPVELGPLYGSVGGKLVAIAFAFVLGFGATIAEPALNAMGIQVENLTQGAFKRSGLIITVAAGVGLGIAIGVATLVFSINFLYILLPSYLVILFMTRLSDEIMVNIGWDSAGVTTGPITVPLVIALGLGIGGNIPTVVDGFGILALASAFPVLSVLGMGLIVKRRAAG